MQERNSICLLFILLSFQIYQAHEPYRSNHIRATSFDTVEKDRALINHVIEVVHEYEPLDCSFACLQTTGCQSYNLRKESTNVYECELSSSTKTLHLNDFKVTSGVTYYGTDTFPGLGCSIAKCPKENCKETKIYPFYECQDVASVLTFPSGAENTITINGTRSLDAFSICFWFKTLQARQTAFLSYNTDDAKNKLNLAYNDSKIIVQMNDLPTNSTTFDVPPIEDGQWHHMCTTWNSSSGHVNIYVDGGLRSYDSGATHFKGEELIEDGTFVIGSCQLGATELGYTGKISELHVWSYVLPSDKVKEIAKNCTVSDEAGGDVVKWERDFVTTQDDTAEQRVCSTQVPIQPDSDLHFPGKNESYQISYPNEPSLNKFTISWWLKTSWIPTAESQLMAIASIVFNHYTELLIAVRGTFEIQFELNRHKSFHKLPPINDDRWHHMVITWQSDGGRWDFFFDGTHRSSIDNFRSGFSLRPNPVLVIGQNGHRSSTAYSSDEDLHGSLSRFNIWDRILPVELIVALAKDPGHDEGNIYSWRSIYNVLKYLVNHTEPSTVVSSAGSSNIGLTLKNWTAENYAILPYDGSKIGKLTVCAWVDLSYEPDGNDLAAPAITSYSATSGSTNELFLIFVKGKIEFAIKNSAYSIGDDSFVNNKKWRYFCLTWDTEVGEAHAYAEGKVKSSKTDLPKNILLDGKGLWVFTNENDKHGGGFEAKQNFHRSIAQLNVWNYVLPSMSMEGLSYGGTSVEGNLFRWTDIVANYNPGGSVDVIPFHLYLPDAVSQKKRDEICNGIKDTHSDACMNANELLYARVGPQHVEKSNGLRWRCYCEQNVGEDKNVKVISIYYLSNYGNILQNT